MMLEHLTRADRRRAAVVLEHEARAFDAENEPDLAAAMRRVAQRLTQEADA